MFEKLPNLIRAIVDHPADAFSDAARNLPEAVPTPVVSLTPGQSFELRAEMVRKKLGPHTVKMLAST